MSPPGGSNFKHTHAAVELRFVQAKAQAHRLAEGRGEGVQVGETPGRADLTERDGSRVVVQSHTDPVATHLAGEAGLPAVVPGRQLPVVLLG